MSVKTYYKMIELHSNKFIETMKADKKFSPYMSLYSKTLLQCAVVHDNFDAFTTMIEHPAFKSGNNKSFLYNISERIAECDWERNKRYLDALIGVEYNFTIADLSYFKSSYDIFMEIFDKINNPDYKSLLKSVAYYDDSIKLDLLERIIKYHKDNNIQLTIVDFESCILRDIGNGSMTCLEIILKNGYNISTVNFKPIISYVLNQSYTSSKNKNGLINYLLNQNWKYNVNLLDYLNKPSSHYDYNGLLYLKKNHSKLKSQFDSIKDSGNLYFISFVMDSLTLFNTNYYSYYLPQQKNLLSYWGSLYYLLQIADENNVTNMIESLPKKFYEQANEVYSFPILSNQANKKLITQHYVTQIKPILKEFLSIMFASKQTQSEDFKNLLNRVFTADELAQDSGLIQKYKTDFTEQPKKKVTKKKVKQMDI